MYDAFLLVSFGGPEGPDDVMPFLRNVTRGRGVPDERLATVAEHYRHFGGVSPINGQNRALLAAVAPRLDLPVYWGNRNWHPLLTDTVRRMRDDGVRRAVAFVTSPYGSYSSCRQYREDIARARAEVGEAAPEIVKIRHYHDHPGFVAPFADAVRAAYTPGARVVFTAHSIPSTMDASSGPDGFRYSTQLRETARLVADAAGAPDWDLVWQSRSGPPSVPWLAPDVNDHLEALAKQGVEAVVAAPIGFVSDHIEVIWDLDHEAAATAARLGLRWARAATPGTDPRFVTMVTDLVEEYVSGALPDVECPVGCCTMRP
jgi:protoporphyrin/coproporphyrin ferrochelatase